MSQILSREQLEQLRKVVDDALSARKVSPSGTGNIGSAGNQSRRPAPDVPTRTKFPTVGNQGDELADLHAMSEYPEPEVSVERQHINPPWDCWCDADLVLEPGDGMDDGFCGVWVHHGNGDELASPREIVEAINAAIAGRHDD